MSDNSAAPFVAGDELTMTMHVNIPNATPLMTRLKKVVVERAGAGKSHVLFDNFAATEKGIANRFEHKSVNDQADSTSFRLTRVTVGVPASDPVFTASGSVDQYSVYSIATVEYQAASGRRVAEVTTVRALPAKRGMAAATVDVIATNSVSIDTRQGAGAGAVTGTAGSTPSSSNSTIILISVCAVVGAVFVVAGTVFLVRNRVTGMHSRRVEATKTRSRFYSKSSKTVPAPSSGVFLGDVQLDAAQRAAASSPTHVEEAEPEAVTVTRAAEQLPKRTKIVVKKLRVSKTSATVEQVQADLPFAVPGAPTAPARRTVKKTVRKMRNVASA